MRIIAGIHKSKRLTAPKNLPVRPTTDMAKEALFNIVNNYFYFDQISVLDLFSGTGNISYEFASRGTEQITAVDQHYGCIKFINQTAKQLDLDIHTLKADVYSFLDKHQQQYDIVFADPPYEFTQEQFNQIAEKAISKVLPGGLLIIEHSSQTSFEEFDGFSYSKRYGGNYFSFFELEDEEENND